MKNLNIGEQKNAEPKQMILNFSDIYPLHLPGDDEKYKTVVTEHRSKFCMDGLVAFPNFFRAELLPQVVKEISERDSETIKTSAYHTIYVDEGDEAYPENHVRNRKYHTKVRRSETSLKSKTIKNVCPKMQAIRLGAPVCRGSKVKLPFLRLK